MARTTIEYLMTHITATGTIINIATHHPPTLMNLLRSTTPSAQQVVTQAVIPLDLKPGSFLCSCLQSEETRAAFKSFLLTNSDTRKALVPGSGGPSGPTTNMFLQVNSDAKTKLKQLLEECQQAGA